MDTGTIPNHLRVQVFVLIFSKEGVVVKGGGAEWTGNTVSIALLTLYRGGHHSKSIFLYSILSEIPTLYIFKKNAAIFFLIEPGPYFILNPEKLFLGEIRALHKEELFDIFYETLKVTLKMECICYTSPRGELFSTEH